MSVQIESLRMTMNYEVEERVNNDRFISSQIDKEKKINQENIQGLRYMTDCQRLA